MNKQEKLNKKHAHKPVAGDYWHDMFTPVCVILDVNDTEVVFCACVVETKEGRWTWGLHEVSRLSRKEFQKSLEYETIPGGYMANVSPGLFKWAAREHKKAKKQAVLNAG